VRSYFTQLAAFASRVDHACTAYHLEDLRTIRLEFRRILSILLAMTARRIIYSGRVQGVGFRWTAKELARGYDVLGTVRNLPDGTVELIVAGEHSEVTEFLRDLREDSVVAHHIKAAVEEKIATLPDLKGFTIVA
jgi:acylphosphatase